MAASKKGPTLARPNLKPAEAVVNAGKEAVEAVVKVSSDAAARQYEQTLALTKENVEKASEAVSKSYEEIATLNKETIEALVQSSTAVAEGVQDATKQLVSYAQTSLEENVDLAKKLFTARNLQEVLDLQSTLLRKQFDQALSQSARLTELSLQVTNRAMEPFQTQVTAAFEKFMKPLSM